MSKLQNPFVLLGYAGEEYFCDREKETEELISALRNGRNITLRSPRRIGKTGLIFLNDNEYIYPTENGYIVYERFMAIWLQRL